MFFFVFEEEAGELSSIISCNSDLKLNLLQCEALYCFVSNTASERMQKLHTNTHTFTNVKDV